jgi:regulator of protease activity HflC (stomatin/prohibitin superfamily)
VLSRIPENQVLNLFQNYRGDVYETLVNPQVQEAFRQIISQYKADAVTKNVNGIKNQVLVLVRENLKNLVEVTDIPVTHISLPQILQDAIAQKQVMEQQSLQKQYELDAAKKQADITVANAQAQAESIRLQTQALEKSPALIELKKAEKWDGHLPTTVVSGSNNANLFQLK